MNTALAPVLVAALFLVYTGVDLDVPVPGLVVELAATTLIRTVVDVAIRTLMPTGPPTRAHLNKERR